MIDDSNILLSSSTLLAIRDRFVTELEMAKEGKKASFPFIRNPLPHSSLVKEGEKFQAMVIGASVFVTALLTYKKGQITILKSYEDVLPKFQTQEDLFLFFEKHLDVTVSKIALNFGYDLHPVFRNGVLDGEKTSRGSKENMFEGLPGKLVGKEIENYILKTQKRRILVSVANDAICLLLSGLGITKADTLASYILGSGVNCAFFLDASTAINLESGNFHIPIQTETGKTIDQRSVFRGIYLFEKEVSGLYLYQHYNLLVKNDPITSTKELSHVAQNKSHSGYKIARELFQRSASLAATQLAGMYFFKQLSHLTFIMEGSVYWKGYEYKEHVNKYLEILGVPKKGISIIEVKDSAILGAARLLIS